MSTPFRYLIVIVAALLLIVGPFCWAMWFTQGFRARYAKPARETHVAEGNAGTANTTDAGILKDFGTEITGAEMNGLIVADLLFKFWWLWSQVVLVACCGLFSILPEARRAFASRDAGP